MNKQQSRTINSIKNVTTSIGGQLLSTILKFIVRTVFIHTLGKSYLGINGLFSDILTMLSLTELGIDSAINYKLYKPLAEKDTKRVRILMKFYKQAYRIIGGVVLLLGICLIPTLPHLIREYDSLAALHINATLIFVLYIIKSVSSYFFFAYRSAIIKADQRKYVLDLVDYIITIIDSVVQILVLVLVKNFIVYTATMIFFIILRNLVNAVIATKQYPDVFLHEKESISKDEVVATLKDCGALFAFKLNGVIAKATDNTVISAFIGLPAVGLYSNYLLFYTTIKSLLDKIYVSVKASMGNLFALSDINKKYSFFLVMNFLSVILFGTAALGVSICADELIEVWIGNDFIIPTYFSALVGIEIFLHGITMNLEQIRNVTGVFRQMWYRPFISALINLVVSICLVQVIGIHGVIIGTILSILLTNIAFDPGIIYKYSFENYKSVSSYYLKNLLYVTILVVVGLFNKWLCSVILTSKGWLSVIVHSLIIVVDVPAVFIFIFRKSEECKYLIKTGERILAKFKKVKV